MQDNFEDEESNYNFIAGRDHHFINYYNGFIQRFTAILDEIGISQNLKYLIFVDGDVTESSADISVKIPLISSDSLEIRWSYFFENTERISHHSELKFRLNNHEFTKVFLIGEPSYLGIKDYTPLFANRNYYLTFRQLHELALILELNNTETLFLLYSVFGCDSNFNTKVNLCVPDGWLAHYSRLACGIANNYDKGYESDPFNERLTEATMIFADSDSECSDYS